MSQQKIYPVGRVYTIRSYQTDEIYIGSTFNPLYKRFAEHKNVFNQYKKGNHNYITSFKLIEYDDCYIELLEEYQNLTKDQLNKHEGEYIRKNNCVNKYVAGRKKKEYDEQYRKDNSNKIKQYRQDNRDKQKQKFNCECGGKFTREKKSQHIKSKKHQNYCDKNAV